CGADGQWHEIENPESPCSPPPCVETCASDGAIYALGDSFPAADSCNTCTCSQGSGQGMAACTDMACDPACEGFSDDPLSGRVSLVVHNDTGRTVYVMASGCADTGPSPVVTSADGGNYDNPEPCVPTCHDLERGTGSSTCSCSPTFDTMAPGAVQEDVFWRMVTSEPATLPAACAAEPTTSDLSCTVRKWAPEGTYQVSVVVYTECTGCPA